jgi:hypothetical protein
VTRVVDGDRLVGAIVHDSALRDERATTARSNG